MGTPEPADRVVVTIDEGVAVVSLNRPEKLNALDTAMFRGLVDAGLQLRARSDVRAVVVKGQGRAFCVGLDLKRFERMNAGNAASDKLVGGSTEIGGATALGQQSVRVWSEVRAPVIAAVHGYALGGGLQIALGADIRVVSPDARMAVMEVPWGLIPDMAGTQLLPELIGRDMAKLLTFTGREVSGSEAVRIGLATVLADDPVDEALRIAGQIAQYDQGAVARAKELLDLAGRTDLRTGLQAEQTAIRALLSSDDLIAATGRRLQELRARAAGRDAG